MSDATAAAAYPQRAGAKETVYFLIILTVIILYCLPVILIARVYMAGSSLEFPIEVEDSTVKWFIAFAEGHKHSLAEVHKVLIPLITFIAAASFATATSVWRTLFLSLVLLFFFFLALGMQVAFEAHLPVEAKQVAPFFSRLEETLIAYLMLILGLEAAKTASDRERGTEPPAEQEAAAPTGRADNAE